MSAETIGDRIRKLRKERDFTQAQVADYVGVSKTAVGLWESGDSKGLKPENLIRAARFLGVPVEELVFGDKAAKSGRRVLEKRHKADISNAIKEAMSEQGGSIPPDIMAELVDAVYLLIESEKDPNLATIKELTRLFLTSRGKGK